MRVSLGSSLLTRSAAIARSVTFSSTSEVPRVTQVVSFDAMNTLISTKEPPPVTYWRYAKNHGFDADMEEVVNAFSKARKDVSAKYPCYGFQNIGAEKWWTMVIQQTLEKAMGRELDADRTSALGHELFHYFVSKDPWKLVDPEVGTALAKLRTRGFGMAVTSNFDLRLRSLLKEFELSSFFDVIVLSGEIGFEKPDPRMFDIVSRHFDLRSPSEILHIGDDLRKDYLGARDYGAKALLFDPLLTEDTVSPDDKITSFKQLSLY